MFDICFLEQFFIFQNKKKENIFDNQKIAFCFLFLKL